MTLFKDNENNKVFRIFEKMCAIPHGSGNTKGISDFCAEYARNLGLDVYQDDSNNVYIRKEASPGYENAPGVVLQGHLDMVCVQAPGRDMDFLRNPIRLLRDGDYITADGTTLGADNGIGAAMALAVLAENDAKHPAIEVFLTSDEETGMNGAEAADFMRIKGRWLINLDSEREGEITAGCAGGVRADCTIKLDRMSFSGRKCVISIGGLKGGHSGGEINLGRASANMLLGRLLDAVTGELDIGIISLTGGTVENAIAAKASAELAVNEGCTERLAKIVKEYGDIFKKEFSTADPDVFVEFSVGESCVMQAADKETTSKAAAALLILPGGVQAMSTDIPGLVQTSLNMGVLRTDGDEVHMTFAVRSSVATQKAWMLRRIESTMKAIGGSVAFRSDYPAWEYRRESALRDLVARCYKEVTGKDAAVTATHGGLECGLFCGKAPDLDCVSIGPDIYGAHSPDEKVSISSVDRMYRFLLVLLENCR